MYELIRAMEILATYHDNPQFIYDEIDKTIVSAVGIDELIPESPNGTRMIELGWDHSGDSWVLYI